MRGLDTILRVFGVDPTGEARELTWQDLWGAGLDPANYIGSKSGKVVTTTSALTVSTVFGSLRIATEAVGGLPIGGFSKEQSDDGHDVRVPLEPEPGWLDFEVGPWTKHDFLAQVAMSLYTDGNAYIATYRDGQARPLWLEVLDPAQCEPERDPAARSIVNTRIGGQTFSSFDVLHIRYMTLPGSLKGLSTIRFAREAIGQSIAAAEMGSKLFANGGIPSAMVQVEGKMSPEGIKALRESWMEVHGGSGNAAKLAILSGGAKYQKINVNPDDLQFLDTRKFSVPDIARFFGVSTSQLNHADGPELGKTISDKNTQWIQYGLGSPVSRIEHGLSWLLRTDPSVAVPKPFVKLSTDGLLRGDFETRWGIWIQAIREGALTINEVRRFEDLPPVGWGNVPISVQVQEDLDEEVGDGDDTGDDDDLVAAGLRSRANGHHHPIAAR